MGHCRIDKIIQLPPDRRGVFVDTGAYQGQSMANALEDGFSRAVGIELSVENFKATMSRFAGDPRVEVYLGSSHLMLEVALRTHQNQRLVIWQDAHYQGVDRENQCSPECGECPVLDEIATVLRLAPRMSHLPLLLLDDAQVFYPPFWETEIAERFTRSDWPTIEQIEQAVGNSYSLRLNTDEEGSQVLVCIPRDWLVRTAGFEPAKT